MDSHPAIVQPTCGICGARSGANHHEPPKSQAGKHDHTISLCGIGNESGCHGLAHHNGGNLTFRYSGDDLLYKADDRAAEAINDRRKSHGLNPIQPGCWVPYIVLKDGVDEYFDLPDLSAVGSLLDTSREAFLRLDAESSSKWRDKAEVLHVTRHALTEALGKQEGKAQFREWHIDTLRVSVGEASKMLTVMDVLLPDELHDERMTNQYQAARAIRAGADRGEVVTDARELSVSDFRAKYFPGKESVKVPCPKCGSKVDPKRLEE